MDIKLPSTYPFSPPKIRFITKIYHCNVGLGGDVRMEMIDSHSATCPWSPAYTVGEALLAISWLLTEPDPYNPIQPWIAQVYLKDRATHDTVARLWVSTYASGITFDGSGTA